MTDQPLEAVYHNCIFKLVQTIPLPDKARVKISVSSQADSPGEPAELGPLAGAFPQLALLSEDDLVLAKSRWEACLAKQIDLLASGSEKS